MVNYLRKKIFDNIWIQPAAGDAGNSLGCALAVNYLHFKKQRYINPIDSMKGCYLGPDFTNKNIEDF